MWRPRTRPFAGAALLTIAFALSACENGRSPEPVSVPAPPACEREARDLNPGDRVVTAARGAPLISRTNGHIPFGFNDAAYLVGQLDLQQTLRLHRAAGSAIIRLPLDWGEVERSPGELDFSKYDEIYCAAVESELSPLWHVTGIPIWAAPEGACAGLPCVRPPEAAYLPQLRRFAELATIRYPRSAAFEAWNEPNLDEFWGGTTDPAAYLPILEAVYRGVKDGNPEMPLLGGALSNNPTDQPDGSLSLGTYLRGMVAGGALQSLDGLSLHIYPNSPDGGDAELAGDLETARSVLSTESPAVRIWVTETGAPTQPGAFLPPVTEQEQAEVLAQGYSLLDDSGDVDAVVFHTLVDPPPAVPGGPGFGFYTAPESGAVRPKPVVCAVLSEAGAAQSCPRSGAG